MATKKAPSESAPGVASVGDVPVTRAMLHGVRDELRARLDQSNTRIDETNARLDRIDARLDGLRAETSARFDATHARFDELHARFDGLRAETVARSDELNARFDGLRAEVIAHTHRIGTIVEEQEVRNRVVMEVVQGHNARFERIEARLDHLTEMVGEILVLLRQRPSV